MKEIKIGDKIRDIEDSDCYYEGVVVGLNPLKYKITNVIWDGKTDDSENGLVLSPCWTWLEVISV